VYASNRDALDFVERDLVRCATDGRTVAEALEPLALVGSRG